MMKPTRPLRRSVAVRSTPASSERTSHCGSTRSSIIRLPPLKAESTAEKVANTSSSSNIAAAPSANAMPAEAASASASPSIEASAALTSEGPVLPVYAPAPMPEGYLESLAIRLDTRGIPAHLLQGKLKPHEVDALRGEAWREYRFKTCRYQLDEVQRQERQARETLEESEAGQWGALLFFENEEAAECGIGGGESRTLARLQKRMQERQRAEAAARAREEARLREEGREAWLAEVALRTQREKESADLVRLRREQENQFRGAVTFIVCSERKERELIAAEVALAENALRVAFVEGQAEAERLAQERFDNSPEQVALRAELERKAAKARRLAAKAERKFNEEQRRFITSCRHAQNGGSLFEGPAPRKVCGRCRVRFDEELGFYISMDGPRPKPRSGAGATTNGSPQARSSTGAPAAATGTAAPPLVVPTSAAETTPQKGSPAAAARAVTNKKKTVAISTHQLSSPIPF